MSQFQNDYEAFSEFAKNVYKGSINSEESLKIFNNPLNLDQVLKFLQLSNDDVIRNVCCSLINEYLVKFSNQISLDRKKSLFEFLIKDTYTEGQLTLPQKLKIPLIAKIIFQSWSEDSFYHQFILSSCENLILNQENIEITFEILDYLSKEISNKGITDQDYSQLKCNDILNQLIQIIPFPVSKISQIFCMPNHLNSNPKNEITIYVSLNLIYDVLSCYKSFYSKTKKHNKFKIVSMNTFEDYFQWIDLISYVKNLVLAFEYILMKNNSEKIKLLLKTIHLLIECKNFLIQGKEIDLVYSCFEAFQAILLKINSIEIFKEISFEITLFGSSLINSKEFEQISEDNKLIFYDAQLKIFQYLIVSPHYTIHSMVNTATIIAKISIQLKENNKVKDQLLTILNNYFQWIYNFIILNKAELDFVMIKESLDPVKVFAELFSNEIMVLLINNLKIIETENDKSVQQFQKNQIASIIYFCVACLNSYQKVVKCFGDTFVSSEKSSISKNYFSILSELLSLLLKIISGSKFDNEFINVAIIKFLKILSKIFLIYPLSENSKNIIFSISHDLILGNESSILDIIIQLTLSIIQSSIINNFKYSLNLSAKFILFLSQKACSKIINNAKVIQMNEYLLNEVLFNQILSIYYNKKSNFLSLLQVINVRKNILRAIFILMLKKLKKEDNISIPTFLNCISKDIFEILNISRNKNYDYNLLTKNLELVLSDLEGIIPGIQLYREYEIVNKWIKINFTPLLEGLVKFSLNSEFLILRILKVIRALFEVEKNTNNYFNPVLEDPSGTLCKILNKLILRIDCSNLTDYAIRLIGNLFRIQILIICKRQSESLSFLIRKCSKDLFVLSSQINDKTICQHQNNLKFIFEFYMVYFNDNNAKIFVLLPDNIQYFVLARCIENVFGLNLYNSTCSLNVLLSLLIKIDEKIIPIDLKVNLNDLFSRFCIHSAYYIMMGNLSNLKFISKIISKAFKFFPELNKCFLNEIAKWEPFIKNEATKEQIRKHINQQILQNHSKFVEKLKEDSSMELKK